MKTCPPLYRSILGLTKQIWPGPTCDTHHGSLGLFRAPTHIEITIDLCKYIVLPNIPMNSQRFCGSFCGSMACRWSNGGYAIQVSDVSWLRFPQQFPGRNYATTLPPSFLLCVASGGWKKVARRHRFDASGEILGKSRSFQLLRFATTSALANKKVVVGYIAGVRRDSWWFTAKNICGYESAYKIIHEMNTLQTGEVRAF